MLVFSVMGQFACECKRDVLEILSRHRRSLAVFFGRIALRLDQQVVDRLHDAADEFGGLRAGFRKGNQRLGDDGLVDNQLGMHRFQDFFHFRPAFQLIQRSKPDMEFVSWKDLELLPWEVDHGH